MRAVWLQSGSLRCLHDAQQPVPAAGEALVRVRLAGICGTDINLVDGYYDYSGIPGHEFVGEVVAAPGEPELVGERVVGEINIDCGSCSECVAGRPAHCLQRKVLGMRSKAGAFAEYLTLPVRNLHAVPDRLSDASAVFTEPLAAAAQVLEAISPAPADRVLVVGAGRLGQLIAQVVSTSGCDLSVVARHRRQRELLRRAGIRWLSEGQLAAQRFDTVIEATGAPTGLQLARRAVRPKGTIVLKSTYREPLAFDFSSLVVDEISLVGSRCGDFDRALGMLAGGQVDPLPLVEKRYGFGAAPEAFEHAGRNGALKVLFDPAL